MYQSSVSGKACEGEFGVTPQGQIVLDVMDDARGISAGNETRIFEPFFTTRRASGGTGMGLAVVRNLLAAHRAGIMLCSCQPTRFRITFAPGATG